MVGNKPLPDRRLKQKAKAVRKCTYMHSRAPIESKDQKYDAGRILCGLPTRAQIG